MSAAAELEEVFRLSEAQTAALLSVERKYQESVAYQPVDPMSVIVDTLLALEHPEIWVDGQ